MKNLNLLIIGHGKIGKPLAHAAAQVKGFKVSVVDKAAKVTEFTSFMSVGGALAGQSYDLIVVATPMSQFSQAMTDIAQYVENPGTVITDICSAVKKQPYKLARRVFELEDRPDLLKQYIPSNPLIGRGVTNQSIYSNRPVYLCTEAATPSAQGKLQGFWAAVDANPIFIPTVVAHDELTVLNSLWPHFFGFIVRGFAATGKMEIPADILGQISKTTQIKAEELETNLNRWSRFLEYHHQDLGQLILDMSESISRRSYSENTIVPTQSLLSGIATATMGRIQLWKDEHPNLVCELFELTAPSSLSRLRQTAKVEFAGDYNPLEFQAFMKKTGAAFMNLDQAKDFVRSAFALAQGPGVKRNQTPEQGFRN